MSFEQAFNEGVKNFQAKEYAKAAELFSEALVLQPENPTVLTNLALTQYELGHKIEAYVYFKKATIIDPKHLPAHQGLEFVSSQVQVRDIPHQIELYERARNILIEPIPIHIPYFLTWLLILAVGYRWIRHRLNKRKAYFSGDDRPAFGALNWSLSLLLILSASWTIFYNYDATIERGLIKAEAVSLRSAPSIGSPAILELYGGLEVKILRRQEGWIQVQYPGSYSGWLQKESLVEL